MSTYAVFDAEGTCLYVGMTYGRHPVHRWAQHVAGSAWAIDAVRWEVLDESERDATARLAPLRGSPKHATVCRPIGPLAPISRSSPPWSVLVDDDMIDLGSDEMVMLCLDD